jgi:predicted phage terminase large subunit-like protein
VEFSAKERHAAALMAREDLYFFSRWMFLQRRGYQWIRGQHHKALCDALMRVFNGECKRLIINIPPRYSKTELAVVNFMAWCLGKVPDAEFIHTSYSGRLAGNNAWQARELVGSNEYREVFPGTMLRGDSAAKDEWRTTEGGIVYAVGAGGTITGYGAGKHREGFGGAILIDDPHKADEARSDVIRQGVIEWFQNTLESRKNDPQNTPIIVIMQRLHEGDLAGWLLEGGNGEKWEHVCLPAITEHGDALWPAKHTLTDLRRMEMASPYTFAGQYQQAPSPGEGNIFKPDNISVIDALPVDDNIDWVRGWDLAASVPKPGSDPDWTVGGKLGRGSSGRYYIGDITRFRAGPDGVQAALKNTADRDGSQSRISLPQDPGQAGKSQVLAFTRLLEGHRVKSSPETGDKVTRAEPFAAQANVGNVSMLKAPWNDELIAEMRVFPNGKHDDQVDALSRAFNEFVQPSTTGILDFYAQQALEAQTKKES